MPSTHTSRDLWLYPILMDTTNNVITFREGAGSFDLTIPEGIYYAYSEGSLSFNFQADFPSLYDEIEDQLVAAGLSGSYTFGAGTPSGSTLQTNGGLLLGQTSGILAFGWDVTDAAHTFPPYLLGVAEDYDAAGSDPFTSTFTRGGVWVSPRCRSSAFAMTEAIQYANNADRETKQVRRWRTDKRRLVSYHWVPAGAINQWANEDSTYAEAASMATDDHGNYFHTLWENGLSTYRDIILIHNVELADIDLSITDLGDGWEIVSALNQGVADDVESSLSLESNTGAHYGVDVAVWCKKYTEVVDRYPDEAPTYYRRHV